MGDWFAGIVKAIGDAVPDIPNVFGPSEEEILARQSKIDELNSQRLRALNHEKSNELKAAEEQRRRDMMPTWEVEARETLFGDCDTENKGHINREQFKIAAEKLGIKLTPMERNKWFADEKMDFEEFITILDYRKVNVLSEEDVGFPLQPSDYELTVLPDELRVTKLPEETDEEAARFTKK